MADTIKSSSVLNIGLEYIYETDKDSRLTYITVPSPRNNLTEQTIKNAVSSFLNSGLIIDANDSVVSASAITTAYTQKQTVEAVDIGVIE